MPTNDLEAIDVLEALESKLAYIPGGRDREGRPVIVVNVPPELQPTTKPRLESVILYFLSIFSDDTKRNGLVLIIDARRGAWRVARSCIRLSAILLGPRAASVIVVRPDGFWDKRVDSCTKSHKDGEPAYVTLARLHNFIDFAQLPYELGGDRTYDHGQWIQKRVKIEDYTKDAQELVSRMSNLQQRLNNLDGVRMRQSDDDLESYWDTGVELTSAARRILRAGRSLITSMSRESSKDTLDTVQRIHSLLDSIEVKQVEIQNSWLEMERNLDTARVVDDLEKGVSQVTDWILGPADAMLNSCCQVGFDVTSSEELRRQHEELELECRDTYGRYAELLHKIDSLPNGRLPEDLKSQRDFMDFVCRSFASRLERRRNVLITSQRFFRLVSEYFDKTSEVFDKLVMGNRTPDFSQASSKLLKLEKNQAILEALERELVKEGEKLSDVLSMPVKDALGREVHIDYGEGIVNVRDILDATNARKNIFNDSVELQKLSLKQIALIHTYENDAEQAVKWLNDLFNVLLENHMEVGCNANEIQSQKEDHQSFQETAKGTYDYGCQLVNGARVLRLSCRLPLGTNASLFSRLRQAWRQLRSVGQEQLTRLRVCAVFHRSVEDHCSRLRELIETVGSLRRAAKAEDLAAESRARAEIRDVLGNRETLLLDVGRMVRLGRLLRTRLKEPLCHQRMSEAEDASARGGNLTAVEAISAKLAEVTRLAEKLDARLCEAGARTRPVPISTSLLCTPFFQGRSASASCPTSPTPSASTMSTLTSTTVSTATSTTPAISTILPVENLTVNTVASAASTTAFTNAFRTASPTSTSGVLLSTEPLASNLSSSPVSSLSTVDSAVDVGSKDAIGQADDVPLPSDGIGHSQTQSEETARRNPYVNGKDYTLKAREENGAEDANADGYVTATECSTTPIARSRSESFVTTPDYEDATPAPAASPCSCSTWWNMEDQAAMTCTMNGEAKESKLLKIEGSETSKTPFVETNGISPVEKHVSREEIIEERAGKIVKEVTETTTLRVSHDTRLGIASYKVTSNTVHNHHQHYDISESENVERTVLMDPHEKVNGVSHEQEYPTTLKKSAEDRQDEQSAWNEQRGQDIFLKFTKLQETAQEERAQTISRDFKDMSLSLNEVSRHHEDSGIEMSPTKKEERDEGDDFLERARKVSSTNDSARNGERIATNGCGCICDGEYSSITVHAKFTETPAVSLASEGRRRVPLSNPS